MGIYEESIGRVWVDDMYVGIAMALWAIYQQLVKLNKKKEDDIAD
jgi:ribosome-associated translation inhibitor RaiA